jgi:hypothetical protein
MFRRLIFATFLLFQLSTLSNLEAQIPAPHCMPCNSGK